MPLMIPPEDAQHNVSKQLQRVHQFVLGYVEERVIAKR